MKQILAVLLLACGLSAQAETISPEQRALEAPTLTAEIRVMLLQSGQDVLGTVTVDPNQLVECTPLSEEQNVECVLEALIGQDVYAVTVEVSADQVSVLGVVHTGTVHEPGPIDETKPNQTPEEELRRGPTTPRPINPEIIEGIEECVDRIDLCDPMNGGMQRVIPFSPGPLPFENQQF